MFNCKESKLKCMGMHEKIVCLLRCILGFVSFLSLFFDFEAERVFKKPLDRFENLKTPGLAPGVLFYGSGGHAALQPKAKVPHHAGEKRDEQRRDRSPGHSSEMQKRHREAKAEQSG